MKKPENYLLTWIEDGEEKEQIIFSHQYLLETYLSFLVSGRNISSIKAWKCYKKAEREEYTYILNKFIEYGK